MPYVQIGRNRINYGLQGDEGGEVIVFLNGLTQSSTLWASHQEHISKQGYRVLSYDTLGQGQSSKPVLGLRLEDHAETLCQLLDALNIDQCYLAGISFGGVVGLKMTIAHPERVKGLVAMSTFCEMPGQLEMIGRVFHMCITQAGYPLVQTLLMPMNFSSKWIEQVRTALPENFRRGYVINDPYAIQNLMECYVNFQPFTSDLAKIQCPTLIINGEFDYLTPRICHETLRQNIESSRLMIIPHAFHAFTLECPEMSARIIKAFADSVEDGLWQGDKSVWVAHEDMNSNILARRCLGDHMRAVFVPTDNPAPIPSDDWLMPRSGGARLVQDRQTTPISVEPVSKAPSPRPTGATAVKRASSASRGNMAAKAAEQATPPASQAKPKPQARATPPKRPASPGSTPAVKAKMPKPLSKKTVPAANEGSVSAPPATVPGGAVSGAATLAARASAKRKTSSNKKVSSHGA